MNGIPPEIQEEYSKLVDDIIEQFDSVKLVEAGTMIDDFKLEMEKLDRFVARKNFEKGMAECPDGIKDDHVMQMRVLTEWFGGIWQGIEDNNGHKNGPGFIDLESEGPIWSFHLTLGKGLVPLADPICDEIVDMLVENGWHRETAVKASLYASESLLIEEFLKARLNPLIGPVVDFLDISQIVRCLVDGISKSGNNFRQAEGEKP
ncbi:hypothetical protein SEA_LILYPAD_74 [Gordonia phage LilyPad]|nr:hypothetical protein SEA_LILYPAD_74 [Gordonia phage LilyPad]